MLSRSYSRAIGHKVCIIGSGPAGFYTAQRLLKKSTTIRIDILEMLKTPYGLVRYGVSPDQHDIKSCIKSFETTASNPHCRWLGNIALGKDVLLDELFDAYDAIVISVGAQEEKKLNIPGESLENVYGSQKWTRWINAFPGNQPIPLNSTDRCLIIGNGNVSLDVARTLLSPISRFSSTNISRTALSALEKSTIKHVMITGRRDASNASFGAKELRDLFKIIHQNDISIYSFNFEPSSNTRMLSILSDELTKCPSIDTLANWPPLFSNQNNKNSTAKSLTFSFYTSPTCFIGNTRLEKLRIIENKSPFRDFSIDCGLSISCIGYKCFVPGVPSDFPVSSNGVPNDHGRVRGFSQPLFVSGWCKTGPAGSIASTMFHSFETADSILAFFSTIPPKPTISIDSILDSHGANPITFPQWKDLDLHGITSEACLHKTFEKIPTI